MAALETLPVELLDSIIDHLTVPDRVSLWKTSRLLSAKTGASLFGPNLRDETMRHACAKGEVNLIRAVVSCGADPSFLTLRRVGHRWMQIDDMYELEDHPLDCRVSTLGIAMRRNEFRAVEVLVELGARFDALDKLDAAALARFLSRPQPLPPRLTERLLDAGLDTRCMDVPTFTKLFVWCIYAGASRDRLERMLEQGADPNLIVRSQHDASRAPTSAMTAAAETGSLDTAKLLLAHGGTFRYSQSWSRIDYREIANSNHEVPRHCPVIAAARNMGRTGSTEMMDLCLANGGDVDTIMVQTNEDAETFRPISPFTAFLEESKVLSVVYPGVAYFHRHGADLSATETAPSPQDIFYLRALTTRAEPPFCRVVAHEILLKKWGIRRIRDGEFADLMMFLLRNGAGREGLGTWLNNYCVDYPAAENAAGSSSSRRTPRLEMVPEWWDFVGMAIDEIRKETDNNKSQNWLIKFLPLHLESSMSWSTLHRVSLEQSIRDQGLYDLIIRNAIWLHEHVTLGRLVIQRLIDDGANINCQLHHHRSTALHEFCKRVMALPRLRQDAWRDGGAYNLAGQRVKTFVLMLVNMGADPFIKHQGQDLTEWLCSEKNHRGNSTFAVDLAKSAFAARWHFLQHGQTPVFQGYVRAGPR